jgi:hypothetical protein
MATFEELEKLFGYALEHDGFTEIRIEGKEGNYQYDGGGAHNLTSLGEDCFNQMKKFAESSDLELTAVNAPSSGESEIGVLRIKDKEDAEADLELFKKFLDVSDFSVSDIDDAYFRPDAGEDVRPEDIDGSTLEFLSADDKKSPIDSADSPLEYLEKTFRYTLESHETNKADFLQIEIDQGPIYQLCVGRKSVSLGYDFWGIDEDSFDHMKKFAESSGLEFDAYEPKPNRSDSNGGSLQIRDKLRCGRRY